VPVVLSPSPTGLPLLTWPSLSTDRVQAVLTTRRGGVSATPYDSLNLALHVGDDPAAVIRNRELVAAALDTALDDLVFCEQVHQPTVQLVDDSHRGRGTRSREDAVQATDALVTVTPGLVLVVMVADCVPLVLHDPVRGALAVVHAGWAGTVRGVTPAAVAAMVELGCRPADLRVGIGPAIGSDVYQVGDEVWEAADAAGLGDAVRPDETGRWLFDLTDANTRQLIDAGVPESVIETSGLVTGPGTDFYSHRAGAPTGRFAVLARLR
jgi:polyphenol oxidase